MSGKGPGGASAAQAAPASRRARARGSAAKHVSVLSRTGVSGGRESVAWLRARTATTPGRLGLLMLLIAVTAVGAGFVMTAAVNGRRDAARGVRSEAGPELAKAQSLYASLSDADATAATTFLTGGLEPAARRRRYLRDLDTASARLTALTSDAVGSSAALAAVATVAQGLPGYAGLIEAARANNRQGFPVGAAYLREASDRMRETLLPSARRLYTIEAQRLNTELEAGTSAGAVAAFALLATLMVAVLVIGQVAIARRTHRTINIPMALATVAVVAAGIWGVIAMTSGQSALARAQKQGSDPVEILSATAVLALRAQADEGLALAARGGAPQRLADVAVVAHALTPPDGLLGKLSSLPSGATTPGEERRLAALVARFLGLHRQEAALEGIGRFADAARIATTRQAATSDRLNATLSTDIRQGQARLAAAAEDSASALAGLWLGIPLLVGISALLAVIGVQLRINEYR